MSLSRSAQSSPFPSVFVAAVLLGIGTAVACIGYSPAWWQLLVLVVCAGLAAAALIVPALRVQRQADAARAERDGRVTSLAEGIDAALAKLHAATAEAQLLNEQNLRHQSLADELTARLNAAAGTVLENFNRSVSDITGQALQSVARSTETIGQGAQSAVETASAAITKSADEATARFTAEAERVSAVVREQLQAESTRVSSGVAERAVPVERLLAELPAKVAALEALAAKIPTDAAEAIKSVSEARVAALSSLEQARADLDSARVTLVDDGTAAKNELEAVASATRSAITASAEEQAALVQASAAAASESLKSLAQELQANLKTVAEQPARSAPKPRPGASVENMPVQLVLEDAVVAAPEITEPAIVESVEPAKTADNASTAAPEPAPAPEPVAEVIQPTAGPVAGPVSDEPVNPIEFAGERAYDDLASAMDDALAR